MDHQAVARRVGDRLHRTHLRGLDERVILADFHQRGASEVEHVIRARFSVAPRVDYKNLLVRSPAGDGVECTGQRGVDLRLEASPGIVEPVVVGLVRRVEHPVELLAVKRKQDIVDFAVGRHLKQDRTEHTGPQIVGLQGIRVGGVARQQVKRFVVGADFRVHSPAGVVRWEFVDLLVQSVGSAGLEDGLFAKQARAGSDIACVVHDQI